MFGLLSSLLILIGFVLAAAAQPPARTVRVVAKRTRM
jgi:hypothetical protein